MTKVYKTLLRTITVNDNILTISKKSKDLCSIEIDGIKTILFSAGASPKNGYITFQNDNGIGETVVVENDASLNSQSAFYGANDMVKFIELVTYIKSINPNVNVYPYQKKRSKIKIDTSRLFTQPPQQPPIQQPVYQSTPQPVMPQSSENDNYNQASQLKSMFGNNKIEATKYITQTTGLSLTAAKQYVDTIYKEYSTVDDPINNQPIFISKKSQAKYETKERIKENDKNGIACCPKCGCTSISANKKGFGIGKAVIGAAFTPIGLVAGNLGAKKVRITCLKCGNQWFAGK